MLITLSNGRQVPVGGMHKIKIVQKINLLPAVQRLKCMQRCRLQHLPACRRGRCSSTC